MKKLNKNTGAGDRINNRGANQLLETIFPYVQGPNVRQRMCLGCLEDWTWDPDESLCPACRIEHDLHRQAAGRWGGDVEITEWWGPVIANVNAEDIQEGYYVSSTSEPDASLTLETDGYSEA